MEESKEIKRKKTFRLIVKIFNILLLSMISLFLICLMFYVISSKIAEKKEKTPLFGFYTIISPSMEPNINVYDVVLVKKTNINKLKKGDVITFYSTNNYFGDTPITHRIANIDDRTSIIVKGDHNEKADNEKVIPKNIIGKVILVIPSLGKLQFFLASKSGFIVAIIIPAIVIFTFVVF